MIGGSSLSPRIIVQPPSGKKPGIHVGYYPCGAYCAPSLTLWRCVYSWLRVLFELPGGCLILVPLPVLPLPGGHLILMPLPVLPIPGGHLGLVPLVVLPIPGGCLILMPLPVLPLPGGCLILMPLVVLPLPGDRDTVNV